MKPNYSKKQIFYISFFLISSVCFLTLRCAHKDLSDAEKERLLRKRVGQFYSSLENGNYSKAVRFYSVNSPARKEESMTQAQLYLFFARDYYARTKILKYDIEELSLSDDKAKVVMKVSKEVNRLKKLPERYADFWVFENRQWYLFAHAADENWSFQELLSFSDQFWGSKVE